MNSLKQNNNEYYRELIVKHYTNPENQGLIKTKNSLSFHHATNSCVDDFFIELTFDKDIVINAKFDGIGCAISTASIDMFCSMINNKTSIFVKKLVKAYQDMLEEHSFNEKLLENLVAFKNVLKQPSRVKCALIISESINQILLLKVK